MVAANKHSLEVDWRHMHEAEGLAPLAAAAADAPREALALFDAVLKAEVARHYPSYLGQHDVVHVRIKGLPVDDSIRDLRTWHIGNLVKVRGVVTRRSGVFPQLAVVRWDCGRCGAVMGPFVVGDAAGGDAAALRPKMCVGCQAKGGFTVNSSETVYRNYQKLTLQESPGSVPPGRLPRHKEVILLADLIDCARPGEEVEVTGIYCSGYDAALNARHGFPVFSTHIEANHIAKDTDGWDASRLTDQDRLDNIDLSRSPNIGQRIADAIAPSIYGHANIKMALALALFGGVEKQPTDSHRLRGDINVLLLGDPGTAKSQFLKYVEKTASRAVYTTSKGASAVGLTAGVHKDPVTREWVLEGGALVLADKGVCLIDEFDKMNDQDQRLAEFVVGSHARSHPDALAEARAEAEARERERQQAGEQGGSGGDPLEITQERLRKYITQAKQKRPAISAAEFGSLQQVYCQLRQESYRSGGLPIAVRHLESMIRCAEAHARMHLRDRVTADDVAVAIRVMVESFISTQKYSQQRELQRQLRRYIVTASDFNGLLLHLLRELVHEERNNLRLLGHMDDEIAVPCRCLEDKAREVSISDLAPFYCSSAFSGAGFKLDRSSGVIVYTL